MPQAQLVYTCNLSTWEVEAEGWRIHKFILTEVASSKPDWAPGDPASKTKQNKWQQIPQFLKYWDGLSCPDLHTVKSYKLLLCCPCSCLAVLWLGWEVGGWVASWALRLESELSSPASEMQNAVHCFICQGHVSGLSIWREQMRKLGYKFFWDWSALTKFDGMLFLLVWTLYCSSSHEWRTKTWEANDSTHFPEGKSNHSTQAYRARTSPCYRCVLLEGEALVLCPL